jgi:hypothetical protein
VNVWAGVVPDVLIGPYLLTPRLSAQIYRVLLDEMLPELLEEIPLSPRRNMWLSHDGATAHFARQVREHLAATYENRWIERDWPVAWPPRSPPLDLFLSGYMKTLIYSSPVDSEEHVIARIFEAAATIRQQPGIFERTQQLAASLSVLY